MKTASLFLLIGVLFGLHQRANAQTQVQVFDEMMTFINQSGNIALSNYYASYELMMTNNTIRTDGTGKVFQYASYAYGRVARNYGSSPLSELVFLNAQQSFTQGEQKHKFHGEPRDALDIRIYKSGTGVNVDLKLLSWGGGVSTHGVTMISRTRLGGYVIFFIDDKRSFYTITLLGSRTSP